MKKDDSKKLKNRKINKQKNKPYKNDESRNLNFTSKNPQTTNAMVLGIIACVLMFFKSGGFISIILVIFAARKLLKSKKLGENKNYINITYAVVYLPVLVWIMGSIFFAINAVNNVK